MAEEAHESETLMKEMSLDIESQIKGAMRSRVNHFKEQADSLTFEGVRRLLEKDLGLEKCALDVHKRFVKQCLFECLEGAGDQNVSKDCGEMGEKHVQSTKGKVEDSPERLESKNNIKESCFEDEERMEDSPVMGLLTGQKTTKSETKEIKADENKEVPSENSIKKAVWKRASYIKSNSEKVTMAGLRRLLEEDLKLDKYALDPYKKFISTQLDEVIASCEVSEPKKKITKESSHSKVSKKMSSEESSDSSDEESDEDEDDDDDDDDEEKPKKKLGLKRNKLNSEGPKKRKRPEKETKVSGKKRTKHVETVVKDNNDAEDSGNASEDSNSQSSSEKPVKKREASTPAYGKHVEHLKSVIRSCGMSVPPVVYRKVKQVPENKREAQLIKELEEILSREGLSSNPSEKEIKDVRRRKERAKELEGIDMSNIVSSSRRRSTTSYAPPPKPKIPVESDSDSDDTDENDDDDDDDDDNNEEEDGDNGGHDGSQSEESDEEHGDDSE